MNRLAYLAAIAVGTFCAVPALAGAIYPIDRAHFLAGTRFDFKIEFDKAVAEDAIRVRINGIDATSVLGKKFQYVGNEDGSNGSSVIARDT